jgi:predicted transcriptional regulator
MSVTMTLTLDDETRAYLERVAAAQGRTPDGVAAWIVTVDLRRERAIDAELRDRLDDAVVNPGGTTTIR